MAKFYLVPRILIPFLFGLSALGVASDPLPKESGQNDRVRQRLVSLGYSNEAADRISGTGIPRIVYDEMLASAPTPLSTKEKRETRSRIIELGYVPIVAGKILQRNLRLSRSIFDELERGVLVGNSEFLPASMYRGLAIEPSAFNPTYKPDDGTNWHRYDDLGPKRFVSGRLRDVIELMAGRLSDTFLLFGKIAQPGQPAAIVLKLQIPRSYLNSVRKKDIRTRPYCEYDDAIDVYLEPNESTLVSEVSFMAPKEHFPTRMGPRNLEGMKVLSIGDFAMSEWISGESTGVADPKNGDSSIIQSCVSILALPDLEM